MRGKVWLLNVYASWCVSCRDEHPVLLKLAQRGEAPIYGLDWKDKPEDARAWLSDLGNPYVLSASDLDGRVAIDYGVYGAPETYLIDKQGVIRYKQIGPLCGPAPDGDAGPVRPCAPADVNVQVHQQSRALADTHPQHPPVPGVTQGIHRDAGHNTIGQVAYQREG